MDLIGGLQQWWRRFRRSNQDVELTIPGVSARIPTSIRGEPRVVRRGLNPDMPGPLYDMDPDHLIACYPGYANSPEFRQKVLYGETVAFRSPGYRAIRDDALDVDQLQVDIKLLRYELPLALQPHAAAMLTYFQAAGRLRRIGPADGPDGGWENNRSSRLDLVDVAQNRVVLQEARYFDQIATNLSADTNSGALPARVRTLRGDVEPPVEGRLRPLGDSAMANTLGVAAMLYARDGQPLFRERTNTMGSINQRRLHCAVSGVYELPIDAQPGESYGYEALESGMHLEVRQELNLEPGEYRLFPVALARELPRLGKPQLFFIILCDIPISDLIDRMRAAEEAYEYANDPNKMLIPQQADLNSYEKFTYEGWAAYWFARQFLQVNAELFASPQ